MTAMPTLEQVADQITVAQLLPHLTAAGVSDARDALVRLQLAEATRLLAASNDENSARLAAARSAYAELDRVWLEACAAVRNEPDPAKAKILDDQANHHACRLNGAQAVLMAILPDGGDP